MYWRVLWWTFAILTACGTWKAHASTITSNASGGGNWATGATWAGGVAPGSGDSAVIANGDTITIPISTSVTVGTSPANDSGTAAIATATTSGTGLLVVNGTLKYRGPVRLASQTTVGAGAVLTHDSSLASVPSAAHYSWQQGQIAGRTSSVLNLNGSSGSHVTISNAASSGYSGGFITPGFSGTADGGQVLATYVDITGGCGQEGSTSTPCMSALLSSSGDTFSLDHVAISGGNGTLVQGQMHGAAIWNLTNISYVTASPLSNTAASTRCIAFGIGGSFLTNAKTSGTRQIANWFSDGCVVELQGAVSGFDTFDPGLVLDNVWASNVSKTAGPLNYIGGAPNFGVSNWKNVLLWSTGLDAVHAAWPSPSGTLQRSYSLNDSYTGSSVSGSPTCSSPSNVNYHVNLMANDMVYDTWIFEPYANGSSKIQTGGGTGNGSTDFLIEMKNWIELPSACGDGGGFGSAYLVVNALACTPGTNCAKFLFHNNTVLGLGGGLGPGCGNGSERGDYTSGMAYNQGNYNNIYWNPASAAGCTENYTGTVPNGTFVGTQDYNRRHNMTGTVLGGIYRNGATAAYSATPAMHDTTGDPQFTDKTRNFLKWCQTINGADATWLDCKAHFADMASASHNAAYNISDLIDYVRAGFAPRDRTLGTAGSAGDLVGAVPLPLTLFPMPAPVGQ